MEKKFYIQPSTAIMLTAMQSVICGSVTYGGKTNGTGGDAPMRQFSGDTQSLKYLI